MKDSNENLTNSNNCDTLLIMKLHNVQQAAEILGVHPQSLRNWDNKGIFVALRTPGGQRRYSDEQLKEFGFWYRKAKQENL